MLVLTLFACDRDADGDGFLAPVDCDDDDPAAHPGVEEVCGDGIDQGCDHLAIGCGTDGGRDVEDADARLTYTGEYLALSTAPAGDLDGDGVDELLVFGGGVEPWYAVWLVDDPEGAVRLEDEDPWWVAVSDDRWGSWTPPGGVFGTEPVVALPGWDQDRWSLELRGYDRELEARFTIDGISPELVRLPGDLTGDGLGDLVVTSSYAYDRLGAVWVVPGPAASGDLGADAAVLYGEEAEDMAGTFASAGDIDGDGVLELAIASIRGRVWLAEGPFTDTSLAAARHVDLDGAFLTIPAIGDLDGDGYGELVADDTDADVTYVYDAGLTEIGRMERGAGWEDGYVRSAVDFDGDERADVQFSAADCWGRPCVVVVPGPVVGVVEDGDPIRDTAGDVSGAPVGDLDGDGVMDLGLAATTLRDSEYVGRAYVVRGGPGR